jgi:hypothetical protein
MLFLTAHTALFIIISGGMLTVLGHFAPFLILGAVITCIGGGLLYTLDVGSPATHWIGYQVLAGIGLGVCFQTPIMVGQALAEPEDVATVTAILMCKSDKAFSILTLLQYANVSYLQLFKLSAAHSSSQPHKLRLSTGWSHKLKLTLPVSIQLLSWQQEQRVCDKHSLKHSFQEYCSRIWRLFGLHMQFP